MTTSGKMRVFMLCVLVSFVRGSYPSGGAINNPWDGGFGEQVQQSPDESQPPNSVSGQFWWQDNNNSPFAQQQQPQQHHQHHQQQQQQHQQHQNQHQHQHQQQQQQQQQQQIVYPIDAEIPPVGICTAPVCPASSVCVHWQLCRNGLLIADGSAQINQQIQIIPRQVQFTSQSCGSNMICCGVPSCNQRDDLIKEPSNIYTVTSRPPTHPPITRRPYTHPPVIRDPTTMMMMMMGPMRFPGNCSAGLYCIEREECDRNGFVINNPNQVMDVFPGSGYLQSDLPSVPLLNCEERRGNIREGVCCQQVHPNPQGFD